MLNGKLIDGTATLEHNDRIRLAENNYFRFIDSAITKLKSDDDNQEDDSKYDYTFLREEALKTLVSNFQIADAAEEARVEQVAIEMAAKEEEFEKRSADLASKQKKDEADLEAKVAAMNAKFEEQMRKGTEMLAAASEAEKGGLAATQAAEETALKQKLEREKAQMEKELVEGQLMEQRKLSELKHLQEKKMRRSQEEQRETEAEKARIQYDLMDAIPACRQANSIAKELGFESIYKVMLISDQTPMGLRNEVCIQLSDLSGAQELWKIKSFRRSTAFLCSSNTTTNPTWRRASQSSCPRRSRSRCRTTRCKSSGTPRSCSITYFTVSKWTTHFTWSPTLARLLATCR
jgi:hypothetical protein